MGQKGLCGTINSTDSSLLLLNSDQSNDSISEYQTSLKMLEEVCRDVPVNDLISKLYHLIQENLELKETISQNNMALRQQLGLVAKWSQQCETIQHRHKENLVDIYQKHDALQRENNLLKAQSQDRSGNPDSEEDSIIKQLQLELESSENNLKTAMSEVNNIGLVNSKLETDLTLLKRDLVIAKGDQERLLLERSEHLNKISQLKGQSKANKDGSNLAKIETMTDLTMCNDITELKNQLKQEKDTTSTLLQELHDTKNQNEALQSKLDKAKEELSQQKQKQKQEKPPNTTPYKTTSSTQDSSQHLEQIEILKEEVEALESALSDERKKLCDERTSLLRAHTETAKLKRELITAKDDSSRQSGYESKIKELNEQYDGATAKLLSYEELLSAKNEEISRLKKELGQAKAKLSEISSEGETLAILRAQVEVYHADFKAEREAREAIAADREKLREEIRQLQQRNTQLVDELEAYQRRNFDQSGSDEVSKTNTSENPVQSGMTDSSWENIASGGNAKDEEKNKKEKEVELDENLLYCPKCNKSFTEIRPLEEHVNRCLDED